MQLRGMTWDHPRGYAGLEAASVQFEQDTGVSITWDRRSLQEFADASIEGLAAKYDMIILDHPHVGLIADTHSLVALEKPEDVNGISMGGSLESYIWRDQLWAYPVDAACQMAVFRADLCQEQLPCWEAVIGASPADYRMVTPLLPVDAFDMMMTLVAGMGQEALPFSDTEFTSETAGLKALSILKALYRLGPADAVNWNPIRALEAMSTTNDFAYSPCLFGYINYARPGFKPHQLTYAELPSFAGTRRPRGILGGAGIGVSARSKAPDIAQNFAKWVTSEPVQSGIYLENEGQPAHRATWINMRNDPLYSGFLGGSWTTMDAAWTRPRDIWFLGFVDDVCEVISDFFLKNQSEEAFLSEINGLYRKHKAKGDAQ